MITIGLTGCSGSGKSYIATLFERFGIPTINADRIVHTLYAGENPCTAKLAEHFGNGVLNPDYSVNRRALADMVFQDRSLLALLNAIVHPFVLEEIDLLKERADKDGATAVMIDAPQLFESGLDQKCDYVIAVLADEKTRVKRLMNRDGIDESSIKRRLSNQFSDAFFEEHAHFCIKNSEGDDPLEQIVSILRVIGLYHG